MTTTLLAANAAWTGLVVALWTKRLSETHYARLLIVQRSRISLSRLPRYRKRLPRTSKGRQKNESGEPYDCNRQDRRPALAPKKSL